MHRSDIPTSSECTANLLEELTTSFIHHFPFYNNPQLSLVAKTMIKREEDPVLVSLSPLTEYKTGVHLDPQTILMIA